MVDGICPFAEQRLVPKGTYAEGSNKRVGFCDHTAGGFYATLRNIDFWVAQGFCTHFGISRDGEIVQLVNIFNRAWGQGRDAQGNSVGANSLGITWPPFEAMGKINPNEYLISTEHEDAIGHDAKGNAVFAPNNSWTQAQFDADLKLKKWCVEEVRRVTGQNLLKFGIDSLAGHFMFDPVSRASCPGPAWKNFYQKQLYEGLTGADSMRIEHQRSAGFLGNNFFNNGQDFVGEQYINAAIDFALPPEAKFVEIEFLLRNGYAIIKSGTGVECGKVGWGKPAGTADRSVATIGLSDKGPKGEVGKWFSIVAPEDGNKVYIYDAKSIAYLT